MALVKSFDSFFRFLVSPEVQSRAMKQYSASDKDLTVPDFLCFFEEPELIKYYVNTDGAFQTKFYCKN